MRLTVKARRPRGKGNAHIASLLRGNSAAMENRKPTNGRRASGGSSQHKPRSASSSRNSLPELLEAIEQSGEDSDRPIVVRPTRDDHVSCLQELFQLAKRPIPGPLEDWDTRVGVWCDEYRDHVGPSSIIEVNLEIAVYVFDESLERVLVAYGISSPQLEARDTNRMRRFPDVNVGVKAVMGKDASVADRGHFLGHAAGGVLDINLFPQRRELNRGWSSEGKLFRRMERYAATHPGTFVYHRATYGDDTWIPDTLEYGLLADDKDWWSETFRNR